MYTEYWHLTKRPFESGADPDFYYPSESHQGALLKLRYAIENRRGGALLAGGAGLGKTLLIRTLQHHAPETASPLVHIVFPKMATHELLAFIAAELGAPAAELAGTGVDTSIRFIQNRLQQNAEQGRHAVLIIDEAHLMDDDDGLEVIRLLLNFEHRSQPAVTALLVGQPALLPMLDRNSALEERLAIKCLLQPLDLEETISYVNHRLAAAGATRAIFEPESLETLHYLTSGVPRQINRICDLALLIGYAEQLPSLSSKQLESISHELVTVASE